MRQKFFINPFAAGGAISPPIPDAIDPSGFVSYEDGFTFDYQRRLLAGPGGTPPADPLAKSPTYINLNAIFNDITANLQAYQLAGIPEFITPAQNGGTPINYRIGSVLLYSASGNPPFIPYLSITDNNTNTPGGTGWLNLLTLAAPEWTAGAVNALSGASIVGTTLTIPQQPHGMLVYSGAGTYTFSNPAAVNTVYVDFSAAGGGGAFGTIADTGGGGGGGGECVTGNPLSVTPSTNYTITLGSPGTGGHSGSVNGTNAANSTFDTLLTLIGGFGGLNNGNGGASGGAGGQAGANGVFATPSNVSYGGFGGGTLFGTPSPGGPGALAGANSTAPGVGGGGGGDGNGGAGGPPMLRVWW